MNNARTTNILLSVILLVSIANYIKTDEVETTLVYIEDYVQETATSGEVQRLGYAIGNLESDLSNIEMETQMTKAMCSM